MKTNLPLRRVLAVVLLLLVSNGMTAWLVHSHDFSTFNQTCFLNWGRISGAFEDRPRYNLPQNPLELYRIYESNARFDVRYPAKSTSEGRTLTLFCWGIAADSYASHGNVLKVDHDIWQAFLKDGPKNLPVYWGIRNNLKQAGADGGFIHGSKPFARL